MSDQRQFKHGGVEYPLTASTANTLLKDADPGLYYALLLFESVLNTYVGPRLRAQAAIHDLRFPSAVEKTLHYEPTPFLLADDLAFPLFCLYRSEEAWAERTVHFGESMAVWEWAYVLPPLGPAETEALHPILRTVAVVMREFAARSWDPDYSSGQTLRDLSGIQKMVPGPVSYGKLELVDKQDKFWRAITGKLFVRERDDIVAAAFDSFDGADVSLDVQAPDTTTVSDFTQTSSYPAPVPVSISPSSGSKAGGTSFTLTGTGFRVGTPVYVLIGGAYASNVVVTSTTTITGRTPAHDAYPSFAADVQIIDSDGQESTVLEAAYTFTTP